MLLSIFCGVALDAPLAMTDRGILIAAIRRKPLFGLLQIETFALCVVFELVFGHRPDLEVFGFGVPKVEAANGAARIHCEAFGEAGAAVGFGVE